MSERNVGSKKRFGVFEFDPLARELTKHGVSLKVQDQPLQILFALLEQPGRIVNARNSNDAFGPMARSWISSRA